MRFTLWMEMIHAGPPGRLLTRECNLRVALRSTLGYFHPLPPGDPGPVSVRPDPQVLDWPRSKGEGRLTRIKDILRNLMDAERRIGSG